MPIQAVLANHEGVDNLWSAQLEERKGAFIYLSARQLTLSESPVENVSGTSAIR